MSKHNNRQTTYETHEDDYGKNPYTVYITREAREKLDWITTDYDNEIQIWIGGQFKDKIIIEHLFVSEQRAGYSDVDVKAKELIKMRKEYGDKCSTIFGQFHSHNNMGCFWSPTDINMQKKYLKNSSKDFAVFIVGSKGKYLCRIAFEKPLPIIMNDVQLVTLPSQSKELERFKKDIEKKITVVQYIPAKSTKQFGGDYTKTRGLYGNYWDGFDSFYDYDEYAQQPVQQDVDTIVIADLNDEELSSVVGIVDVYGTPYSTKKEKCGKHKITIETPNMAIANSLKEEIQNVISINNEEGDNYDYYGNPRIRL